MRASSSRCVDLDTGVLVRREPAGGYVIAYSNPTDPPHPRDLGRPGVPSGTSPSGSGTGSPCSGRPRSTSTRAGPACIAETPDHHAIVGETPDVPRFLQCVGFGGHGVMHAPAAGRAIAELVTIGHCETFDLRPLRLSRFAEGDLVVETAVL